MYVENRTKIANFPTSRVFNAPTEGFPLEFCIGAGSQETRVMGLSDGRRSFWIGLAVLIQYRSVTASHPASHVPVAITLNAKASSLKIISKVSSFMVICYTEGMRPAQNLLWMNL